MIDAVYCQGDGAEWKSEAKGGEDAGPTLLW